MKNIAIFIFLLLTWLLHYGCASQPDYNGIPYPTKYQLDLVINGKAISGSGVVQKATKYLITIKSNVDIDRFQVATCQRENTIDQAYTPGWLSKNIFQYTIWPTNVENEASSCPLRIFSYNDTVPNNNLFAYVDFYDDKTKLNGAISCNGWMMGTVGGVSVCHAPIGSVQRITFQTPVNYNKTTTTCKVDTQDDKLFNFYPLKDQCFLQFRERGTGFNHRLTILGY